MFFQGKRMNDVDSNYGKEVRLFPAALFLRYRCYERTSSRFSWKAGLTVETACILPLFLWAVLGAFYLMELSLVQTRLLGGIRDTSRHMAMLAYGVYQGEDSDETSVETIIEGTLSAVYAKAKILKKANLEKTAFGGHVQVTLAASDFSDEDIVDLRVITSVRIPIPVYNIKKFSFMERGRVRAWTGRSPTDSGGEHAGEESTELVYVAETGSVYHRSRDCTHIRLSIQSTSADSMASRRNAGGAKYYPCSCYLAHSSNTVYYTKNGNRYHSSLGCSSLKRTVQKVDLSSLDGMQPCSKCG